MLLTEREDWCIYQEKCAFDVLLGRQRRLAMVNTKQDSWKGCRMRPLVFQIFCSSSIVEFTIESDSFIICKRSNYGRATGMVFYLFITMSGIIIVL